LTHASVMTRLNVDRAMWAAASLETIERLVAQI
jgi:hypothetical protein